MELFEKIFLSPNVIFLMIAIIIIYSGVHQYRIDLLIKNNQLNLKFWEKLILFRFPIKKHKHSFDIELMNKMRKLAKEYIIVHTIIFSYFAIAIFYFLAQAFWY